jgi:hypothetical protein
MATNGCRKEILRRNTMASSAANAKKKLKSVQWKPTEADWKKAKTNPIFKHFCMLNQYSPDVNPQMNAILCSVIDLFEDHIDGMTLPALSDVLDAVESEYKQFHGLTPNTKGCENWAKLKSSRLLYGTVKIDRAFEKRAERPVRSIIMFMSQLDEVTAYLKREEAKAA